jgi:phospholipid/cholesterol/gamma-HCH transport system substrate-binding protein
MKRELRIGIFVGAALLVMAAFIFIVGDMSVLFRKAGYAVTVDFDSAGGLEKQSVVKMSGVKIGYIEDIKLIKRKARITLSIFAGVEIPKDSKAAAASLGLLGEKYLDIIPGDAAENCKPGDALAAATSFGFDQIGGLLQSVGTQVKEAGQAVKDALGPETRANLNRTIENLASLSGELKDLVGQNQSGVRTAVDEASRAFRNLNQKVDEAAAGLNDTVRLLKDIAAENRENVKLDLEGIKSLIRKIEETLKILNESLEKVTKGDGSIGKLVRDPGLYDKAERAVESLGAVGRSVASLRVLFDARAEDLTKSGLVRPSFSLGLAVTPRAFFEAGLVRDPWKDEFAFSLLGGYRLGNFAPRFGFIESQFGVSLDYYAFGDAWMVRAEGFDFNRPDRPRFRLSTRFSPWKSLYFVLGADELALASRREIFFGLGVSIR